MVLVPHGRHIGLSLKDDLPTTPHSVASSHQAMQAYDNRADIEPQLAVDGCLFNAIALMEAPQGFRPSSTLTAGSGKPAAVTSPGGGVSGRTYHCQRCLNHGKEVARKGHKRFCEWATCSCVQCVLVEKRKMLNRQINSECERSQPIPSSSSSSSNGSDREGHAGGHSSKSTFTFTFSPCLNQRPLVGQSSVSFFLSFRFF
ncbi:DM DNA binding domain protein [Trichuris suis]|uniref:Uncharacterized protein n=1 Tax=Trichuris suis TaxID=68888 RepID=A0A085LUI5_9BILA|nr:hypothetical protein M513_10486 [Trichuris suis]KHJ40631.1 DM DNA binding domain protein [Trichuris suis]